MTGDPTLFPRPRRRTNRTRGRTLRVEVVRHSAVLHGPHLVGLIDGAQLPRQWDPARRTWMVPARRVDDLIAYAEHAEGRVVSVERGDR